MTRRESFVDHTVAYAAVGASDAPDLLRFPPTGSTPFYEELRLGSGADRFLIASSSLMTWGAHRVNGVEVIEVTAGDGGQYSGVVFDDAGVPQPSSAEDLQFSPDGVPFLRAGSVVQMEWTTDRDAMLMRVVYTIEEARQVGFAVGSADESSIPGEVRYSVEHREDDSVWATVRGFLFASSAGLLGRKGRNEVRAVIDEVREQLNGLAPGAVAPQSSAEQGAAEATASDADDAASDQGSVADENTVAGAAVAAEENAVTPSDPHTANDATSDDDHAHTNSVVRDRNAHDSA